MELDKKIPVGRKHLKQYDLRIIGNSPNYPFHEVAFKIERMLNEGGSIILDESKKNVSIRVHIFDSGKPIIPYELGHHPKELTEEKEDG